TTEPEKPSAIAEHDGHPAVKSGPNMKWYTSNCERPPNSSARDLVPSSVSKLYSFSIGTHGSSCRIRASSSPRRVHSFSASSSSSRAESHSLRVPVVWSVIAFWGMCVLLVDVSQIDFSFGLYGLGEPLDPCQAPVPLRGHASHRFGGIVQ